MIRRCVVFLLLASLTGCMEGNKDEKKRLPRETSSVFTFRAEFARNVNTNAVPVLDPRLAPGASRDF